DKWPSLQDEDATAAGRLSNQEMLRHHGSKRAAADDNHIEIAPSSAGDLGRAIQRLGQGVTQESPHVVERERSRFRGNRLSHSVSPVRVTKTWNRPTG